MKKGHSCCYPINASGCFGARTKKCKMVFFIHLSMDLHELLQPSSPIKQSSFIE
jgi:hypothetical protein